MYLHGSVLMCNKLSSGERPDGVCMQRLPGVPVSALLLILSCHFYTIGRVLVEGSARSAHRLERVSHRGGGSVP